MPKIGYIDPQIDDTDKLAVSVYGKNSAAGDTPLGVSAAGMIKASIYSSTGSAVATVDSLSVDGKSTGHVGLTTIGRLMGFNLTSWDRWRMNIYKQLAASAARTATLTTADQVNYNHKGIILIVDVTARAAACTLTPSIEVKGVTGTIYHKIFEVAAAIDTADGSFAYLFYPTTPDAGSLYTEECNIAIPRTFRVVITHSTANSITYSLDLYYLL